MLGDRFWQGENASALYSQGALVDSSRKSCALGRGAASSAA